MQPHLLKYIPYLQNLGLEKLFFCTKLYDVLKRDKIPVSMINIWTIDFYENPLIPILKKLQEIYIEHHKLKIWATNTLKIGGNFISWTLRQWLKYKCFDIKKSFKQL